jgi:hypothetical protein
MAMDILFFGGFKDGEIAVDTADAASNPYVGGSPMLVGSAGMKLCKTPQVWGLSKNSWTLDSKGDVQVAEVVQSSAIVGTLVAGFNKVKLFADTDDAQPFADTPTSGGVWARGDIGYVDANGVWDNAAAVAKDAPGLLITAVVGAGAAPDSLEAYALPISLATGV